MWLAIVAILGCSNPFVDKDDFSSLTGEWVSEWDFWQAGPTSWVFDLREDGDGPLTGTYLTDYSFKAESPRPDTLRGAVKGDYDSNERRVFLAFTMEEENIQPSVVSCELRAWVDRREEYMGGVLDCSRYPEPSRTGHPIILERVSGGILPPQARMRARRSQRLGSTAGPRTFLAHPVVVTLAGHVIT